MARANVGLLTAGVATAFAAVAVMGLYDAIAFPRGAKGTLGFRGRWVLGSVLFGWTNFLSMGPLGGPALRVIAYRRYGLSAREIARGFAAHYIGISAGFIAWTVVAWIPLPEGLTWLVLRVLLVAALTLGVIHVEGRLATFLRHQRIDELDLGTIPLTRLGIVSFFDWTFTWIAFQLILYSAHVWPTPTQAARLFFTGHFAGFLSMIPGGMGTADAVWLRGFALLGETHDKAAAGILIFRVGFYLVPWIASLGVLYAAYSRRIPKLWAWQRRIVAAAVTVNALLLLASTASPAVRERLDVLVRMVPMGAIDVSHGVAVIAAGLMLYLVHGLLRGYRGAYLLILALLAASVVAHPIKGGDYEEAIASLVLLAMLFSARRAFTRRGRIPIGWENALAAGFGSLVFFLIVGFATFERIPSDIWIAFAERAESSRFLRAGLLLTLVWLCVVVRQALRPENDFIEPTPDEMDRAEAFAHRQALSADPLLVGGGDKGIWFWLDRGVVLFQRSGDKLIVYKDPTLVEGADPAELVADLLQLAEELDVDVVFVLLSARWMTTLHDFGFHFLKVSEEAIVDLAHFTLEGHENAGFRRTLRAMERAGFQFEILRPPFSDAIIDELREVSDAWLRAKGGHELQFTACYFSPAYIQRNPIGVALDGEGRIAAFVNLLLTRIGGPATIDLMRYRPSVLDHVMDFVLIRSMHALALEGYSSFSLGGAALSNVGIWRSSRLIERAMHVFSTKAERFYNYQGLARYKGKFHPEWHPRYLAYRRSWEWGAVVLATSRLIAARDPSAQRRIAAARLGTPRPR